ncbi:MAG: DNA repair protein RadC [Verrucomicrobia bacterium]|nr:DNA repair protein RadC [Verrucomicrobiota bacterium]
MSEEPTPSARSYAASPAPTNRLLALAESERPQERALRHGVGTLGDAELLALLLRSGTRGHDVMSLAARLLADAGSLHALTRWREAEFCRLKGIGRVKALQLCTVMEIVRRVLGADRSATPELTDPDGTYAFMRSRAFGLEVEKCWVLSLNIRNRLIRCTELTSGTSAQTLVRNTEVLREVVREGASSFVIAHNHPSGDPAPSAADFKITRRLKEAAQPLDVHFLDHLILGEPAADPLGLGYYSFRASGLIA